MVGRRKFVLVCSGFGVAAGTAFAAELWAQMERREALTPEMIAAAARVAGIEFSAQQQQEMLKALNDQSAGFEQLHRAKLPNELAPAQIFTPWAAPPAAERRVAAPPATVSRVHAPAQIEDLAFASVGELAALLRSRRISSAALTEMYLDRLQRYDPLLHFVITLTAERARAQARDADREIAAGKYRGPLHGIPWGAKDLLSVRGYRTTWGANQFAEQHLDDTATVVDRLDRAGAVLVAKLSLGTLAMGGDEWFGGMTRNPWKPEEGSLGSSAGPASAVGAGCVGFAIGSETLDSISAPCARCGATGLRPTFGRVPRTGCMALCWSMDKLGPIARTAEDCALVLAAINGPDGQDQATRTASFEWAPSPVKELRVGFLEQEFRGERAGISGVPEPVDRRRESEQIDSVALDVLRGMGINLRPVELPLLPWRAMLAIPKAEAAAAFEELTRTHHDALLAWQQKNWPNVFRVARFIPAVEYINADRLRRSGMEAMELLFRDFDVVVAPTNSVQLIVTNLTGHPAVVVPNGFRADGTPTSITFLGQLWGEAKVLALAHAYQSVTSWRQRHPQQLLRNG
jgi:Asp-tRNA(Asn)/Glu-tRNA(Gln) amidotransferase A subunit family amidase